MIAAVTRAGSGGPLPQAPRLGVPASGFSPIRRRDCHAACRTPTRCSCIGPYMGQSHRTAAWGACVTVHQPPPGKFRFVVDDTDQGPVRERWHDGPDLKVWGLKLWMRRHRIGRLAVAGAAAGLAVGLIASGLRAPAYRASSELILSYTSLQLSGQDAAVTQMLVDGSVVQSQIELVRSNGVLARTVQRLGAQAVLDMARRSSPVGDLRALVTSPFRPKTTPDARPAGKEALEREAIDTLRGLLTVRRLGASQIISIAAVTGSGESAADLANAVAQDFLEEQREMNALVTTSGVMRDRIRSIGPTLRVVSRAVPTRTPSSPGALLVLALGGLLGASVTAAAGAGRVLADRRIILPEQLAAAADLACFGNLPRLGDNAPNGRVRPSPPRKDPDGARPGHQPSIMVNVLRLARASIIDRAASDRTRLDHGISGPRYVGFTSCAPGEGKSTVALAFAHLMASEGQRVLLVDASSPSRELTRWLAPGSVAGLGDALRNPRRFADVVLADIRPNLDFLAGAGQGSDLDDRWRHFTRDWRPAGGGEYDWCVFDLPSLNPSIDVRVAGAAMDRLVLVTQWGRTHAGLLEESLAALGPVRNRFAGAIINQTPPSALRARELINADLRLPALHRSGVKA
jgi:Mrp family chromosome partitioning ATPase